MWSSSWQRPSARVVTTARTANAEFRHGLCAYVVTGYENEDYVEVVLRETDVHSIDVVLDTISTDTVTRSPHVLAQLDRLVSHDRAKDGIGQPV